MTLLSRPLAYLGFGTLFETDTLTGHSRWVLFSLSFHIASVLLELYNSCFAINWPEIYCLAYKKRLCECWQLRSRMSTTSSNLYHVSIPVSGSIS